MLVRLLYASRQSSGFGPDDMAAIQQKSQANNSRCGVTGLLCASGSTFVQVLEGGRAEVNSLYRRIIADPRHTDVTILSYSEIGERRFSRWSMGLVNTERLNHALLLKYSPQTTLDPFGIPAQSTLALVEEFASTASIAVERS